MRDHDFTREFKLSRFREFYINRCMEKFGIHWFRRDLRVAGNKALKYNWKVNDKKVLGIFCFDKKFLSRPDMSYNRFQFFIETLMSLKTELNKIGSDLLVLDIGPQDAFKDLLEKLKTHQLRTPELITWNRDYEPFAVARDNELKDFFEVQNIKTVDFRDHLTIEPHELYKSEKDLNGYQVYSPFARKWLSIYVQDEFKKRVSSQKKGFEYLEQLKNDMAPKIFDYSWQDLFAGKMNYPDNLSIYYQENLKKVTVPIPESGSLKAYEQLQAFKVKLDNYGETRDFPNVKGTSKLSMYLKNGSITVPQIIHYFNLQPYVKKQSSRDVFFSELIWREFYYHIIYRHPRVERESFLDKYKNLKWENNEDYFQAWKDGKTGFPIVDAGMRELKTTGWMHNRVRMIVASFLTKDLLINWQWGEKYFMETLLDGDLAPNNGGWQWAASTGCDPQPYFRIFNPWSQSKKFDKDGHYIKTFLPELNNIEAKKLHEPIIGHSTYPEPIVDHKTQREKALAMYKAERV